MKLRGWSIRQFGHFSGYTVQGLPDGITVVHGANEAGKSTLLAFVRGTLFGFPDGRSSERRLTHGEGSVGELHVERDGQSLVLERRMGPKQPLTITLPNGTRAHDEDLAAHLGISRADRTLFENVFAFSLRELQQLGSLTKETVKDQVFAAAVTGAGRPPKKAAQELEDAARPLYRKGTATNELTLLLEDLDGLDRRRAAASQAAQAFPALFARCEEIERQLRGLRDHDRELRARRHRLASLAELAPLEAERAVLAADLERLPDLPELPVGAVERLAEWREPLRIAGELLEEQTLAKGRLARALEELELDDAILPAAEEIERVVAEAALQQERLNQRVAVETEWQRARSTLDDALRRLGAGWSDERLRAWDPSASRRAALRQWQSRLHLAAREVTDAEYEVRTGESKVAEREAELRGARAALPAPEPRTREAIATAEGQLAALARCRDDARDLRDELRDLERQVADAERAAPVAGWAPIRWLAAVGLVLALAGVASAFVRPGAVTAVCVLAGVGALAFALSRKSAARGDAGDPVVAQLRRREAESRKRATEVRARAAAAARALGLSDEPAPEEVARIVQHLREERSRRDKYDERLLRCQQLQLDVAEAEERARKSEARLQLARDGATAQACGWRQWLGECGLGADLSPEAAQAVFEAADAAWSALATVGGARQRVEAHGAAVVAWSARARALLASLGDTRERDEFGLLSGVRSLDARLREARLTQVKQESLLRQIAESNDLLKTAGTRRGRAEDGLRALLEAAGAASEEELLTRAGQLAERAETVRKIQELERQIAVGLQGVADREAARAELARVDVAAWAAQREATEQELAEGQTAIERCISERAIAEGDRDRLAASADVAEIEIERAALVARIGTVVRDWRRLQLARLLVERTREQFERDRQPLVIQHAEPVFRAVTDGRYDRLLLTEDGGALQVIDRQRKPWDAEALSQGTQEQLYLSLRLGLAEEFASRRTSLPLVMDDVLVNFDPTRARHTARALAQVAAKRQVVVFTCHPWVVDLLRDACPDAHVLELAAPVSFGAPVSLS